MFQVEIPRFFGDLFLFPESEVPEDPSATDESSAQLFSQDSWIISSIALHRGY